MGVSRESWYLKARGLLLVEREARERDHLKRLGIPLTLEHPLFREISAELNKVERWRELASLSTNP